MKQKSSIKNSKSNILQFSKSSQKEDEIIVSTIAAIIAIKIEHPKNISPEDYFIDKIEAYESIDILAFEDALDNEHTGITSNEAQFEAINDA